jgi:hypothetical protein
MAAVLNGFPSRISGPMVWNSSDFDMKPDLYISNLSEEDISHINSAIAHFKGTLSFICLI